MLYCFFMGSGIAMEIFLIDKATVDVQCSLAEVGAFKIHILIRC